MRRRLLFLLLSIIATAIVLGFVFAGSSTTLANGVTIDGIDVGGMSAKDARALLQRRSDAVANKPVVFLAGGKRYSIRPAIAADRRGTESPDPAARSRRS